LYVPAKYGCSAYFKIILIYKFRPNMDQWMTLLGNKYLDPLMLI